MKKEATSMQMRDGRGLTSSHHMALEAFVRRVKVLLKLRRERRERELLHIDLEETPQAGKGKAIRNAKTFIVKKTDFS